MFLLAVLAGVGMVGMAQGFSTLATVLPVMAIPVVVGLFLQWKTREKTRMAIESTEIEIDDDVLAGRTSLASVAIRSDEVTELRYLADGLLVRGRDLPQTLHLKTDLEGFEELRVAVEAWAPANVPRKQSAVSMPGLTIAFPIAALALMVVAFTATDPRMAVPVCVIAALALVACIAVVWQNDKAPRQLRWMMLAALLPAASLLGRAYLLWAW
ncbi:MAG: hypothetical protein IT162_13405 [Bryobacterales bacterium]|nr:hypothetical protein [Bryobacterales bacterium]